MMLINHLHKLPVFKDEWIYTSTPARALISWARTAVPFAFLMVNVDGVHFSVGIIFIHFPLSERRVAL